MADDTPEIETPPETPPEAPVTPPKDEPEHVAAVEGEKVPEWGQALISKVEGLTEALTKNPSDVTPTKKPWHKRGMK